jgi:hypothetical protein
MLLALKFVFDAHGGCCLLQPDGTLAGHVVNSCAAFSFIATATVSLFGACCTEFIE